MSERTDSSLFSGNVQRQEGKTEEEEKNCIFIVELKESSYFTSLAGRRTTTNLTHTKLTLAHSELQR